MNDRLSLWVAWCQLCAWPATCAGGEAVRSRLIEGSTLVDACPVCARPEVEIRLSGVLDVVPANSHPLFTRWQLVNLQFTDGSATPGYSITGEGWIEIGGEVAVVQRGGLDIVLTRDGGQRRAALSCPPGPVERVWPMWKATFVQTDGSSTSEIHLTLAVAPVRELWFNPRHGLTSGLGQWPTNRVRPADILSETGRRVHDGGALFAAAGVTGEEAEQADIDAFEVESAPPGRLLFSPDRDVRSSLLGVIREGDVVAVEDPTSLSRRNGVLLQSFGLMPPIPDLGLDAIHVLATGEIWFSIRGTAFSEKLGVSLGPGDLLSDAGRVVRSASQFLARFQPVEVGQEFGLDGFYVWPSGEVWFTVETGFQDRALGPITDGDLLSDEGYVVARNLDLVREFQPLEDLANFGLQGVFIISDVGEPPAKPPQLDPLPRGAHPVVSWAGPGRVFQVETTRQPGEPFEEESPLLTGRSWRDEGRSMTEGSRHYRLRAW